MNGIKSMLLAYEFEKKKQIVWYDMILHEMKLNLRFSGHNFAVVD